MQVQHAVRVTHHFFAPPTSATSPGHARMGIVQRSPYWSHLLRAPWGFKQPDSSIWGRSLRPLTLPSQRKPAKRQAPLVAACSPISHPQYHPHPCQHWQRLHFTEVEASHAPSPLLADPEDYLLMQTHSLNNRASGITQHKAVWAPFPSPPSPSFFQDVRFQVVLNREQQLFLSLSSGGEMERRRNFPPPAAVFNSSPKCLCGSCCLSQN